VTHSQLWEFYTTPVCFSQYL